MRAEFGPAWIALAAMCFACAASVAAAGETPSFFDSVTFGDPASESAHGLASPGTTAGAGGFGQTCRRLGPDGSLEFDLKCNGDRQNYLTVKFWGSDTEVATLFMSVGGKRYGTYGDAWPELDAGMGGAAFPGRFYYSTYMIPGDATRGKSAVRLKLTAVGSLAPYDPDPARRERPLTGRSRGIYRAYSGTDPFVKPGPDEPQGKEPAAKIPEVPAGFTEIRQLRTQVDDAFSKLIGWQLFGRDWDEAVAQGKVPAAVIGAIARGANPSASRTPEQWKDFVAAPTTGNCIPINALAIYAKAYQAKWSGHNRSAEILQRVARGMDAYCVLQGSNGAFTSKTWIGGPNRRPGVSCLEGFGTQALGQAVLILHGDLAAGKMLEQPTDSDGDPSTPPVPRRAAWADMLCRHRDFLTSKEGRGHATNQDLAQMTAMWSANEAVRLLDPKRAWPREKAMEFVYAAVGLRDDPLGGRWVTTKGLALEPWGTLAGGYCGNYGLMAVHQICFLAEMTGDAKVRQRAAEAVRAAAFFIYPAIDENGQRRMKKEGIISTRNTKWPCATDYGGDYFAAAVLREPLAVRSAQLAIADMAIPWPLPEGNAHFIDSVKPLIFGMEHYEAAFALPPVSARLPMEAEHPARQGVAVASPDFAWADEEAGAVAVKRGGERLYMSLNWRRGFRDNKRDPEHTRTNSIARIHFTTPTLDRIATIAMESIDGFGGLYLCRYGDYYVAMNASASKRYPLALPANVQPQAVRDLVSGRTFAAGGIPALEPRTTMVLHLER